MRQEKWQRLRDRYLFATAGCLVFGAVYELFSHRVYSPWMIFAFLIPFTGGVLPCTALWMVPRIPRPGVWSRRLWNSGVAVLTAGSLFRGILEIYGTTNRLEAVYWTAGAALAVAGLAAWFRDRE